MGNFTNTSLFVGHALFSLLPPCSILKPDRRRFGSGFPIPGECRRSRKSEESGEQPGDLNSFALFEECILDRKTGHMLTANLEKHYADSAVSKARFRGHQMQCHGAVPTHYLLPNREHKNYRNGVPYSCEQPRVRRAATASRCDPNRRSSVPWSFPGLLRSASRRTSPWSGAPFRAAAC